MERRRPSSSSVPSVPVRVEASPPGPCTDDASTPTRGSDAELPFGLALVDRDLRIVQCNRVMAAFCGWPDDGPAPEAGQRLGGRAAAWLEPHLREVLASGEARQGLAYVVPSDDGETRGDEHRWRVDLHPRRNRAGETVGVHCIVQEDAAPPGDGEARTLLAAIVDSSNDAVISKSLDGIITSWNAAAQRMFGYTPEEAVGQSITFIIPDEYRDEEDRILARLRRGERIEHYETQRVHRDGRRLDVSLTISPVRDRTGRIVGASKISRDITEQKRAERALRESEGRFRMLADSAPVLIWMSGPDHEGVYFNQPWLEFTGQPLRAQRGDGWLKFVHPDDRERLLEECLGAFREHRSFTTEFRMRRADGVYRWMLDSGTPRLAPDGTFLGFIGTCVDIQAQKQAEEAARQSEAWYRRILHAGRDALLVYPVEPDGTPGRLVEVNAEACARYGYTREELLQRTVSDLVGKSPDEVREALRLALSEGEALVETEHLTRDGKRLPVEVALQRTIIDGRPHVIASVRDISRRVAAQREREASADRERARADELNAVMQSVPAVVFIAHDPAARRVTGSHAAYELLRVPRGRNLSKSAPGGERPETFRVFRDGMELAGDDLPLPRAGRGEAVVGEELEIRLEDGESRFIYGNAMPLRDPAGRVRGAVAAFVDVTDRKRAEEAVAASEQRHRIALDAGRMGAWEWDCASNTVTWTDTLETIHGLEPGTFGGSFDDFHRDMHPDDRQRVLDRVQHTLRTHEPYHVEYRIIRPDGEVRWLEARGELRLDDGGRPQRMVGVCTDVTERRHAETALRESEERFRLALASGAITVYEQDCDLRYTWIYPDEPYREDVLGRSDDDLSDTPEGHHRTRLKRQVLETGEPTRQEVSAQVRGEQRWFDLLIEPRRNARDEIVGVGGMALDITDRRRAQIASTLLARASREFATSLDYEQTLANVAHAVVPAFADWCAIDIRDEDGSLRRLAAAHADPKKVSLAGEVHRRWPPNPDAPQGPPRVARSGEPALVSEITDEMLEQGAQDPEHARVLRKLALRSYMCVPLQVRGRPIGAVTFIGAESGRRYDEQDLAVALDLARRASQAIENALLYRELSEGEQRFRVLAEVMPQLVWTSDADGAVDYCNPRWLAYTGLSEAEVTGDRWTAALHPDDVESTLRAWRDALRHRREYEIEQRLRSADGGYRWYLARALPLPDERGRVVKWLGTCTDIDDQKQAETALREGRERLQAAISASRTGTYRWDFTTESMDWDESVDRLFGLAPGATDPSMDTFLQSVDADDRRAVREAVEHSRRSGADFEMDFRVVWPDGSVRWIYDKGRVFSGPDGKPAYMTGACTDITDRKAAEGAVRESERRFRALANLVPQLMWINRPDGATHYYNDRWYEYTGMSADTVDGDREWIEFVHPDDRERLVGARTAGIRTGTPYEFEYRLRSTAGGYRWHIARVVPVRDARGEIEAWFGTATDVHDLKVAEEALRASEDRFRTLADNIAQFAWMTDEAGWTFWYNRRWYEYTGTNLEQMQGWGWTKVNHPDHVDRVVQKFARCIKAGEVWEDIFPLRGADGQYRWFLSRAVPIRDADGRVVRWFGTNTDITAQREIEEALRASEARYRAVVESQTEMVCRFRPDGELLFVNGAYARARGTTPEALIRNNFWDFIDDADRPAVREMLDRLTPDHPEVLIENRFETTEGVRWTMWTNRALAFDDDGRAVELQSTGIDITERKRHEEQMALVMAELNHRVKNTLASVQATAMQTMRSSASLEEFGQAFGTRLQALAQAHSLLTRTNWEGVGLHDLVHLEVDSRVGSSQQAVVEGPHLLLRPKPALALHMIIHELSTNAAKYGALSTSEGRVHVSWRIATRDDEGEGGDDEQADGGRSRHSEDNGPRLIFRWTERGGPPVSPPSRTGFGTKVLEQTVVYELDGEADVRFEPEGLSCELTMPLDGALAQTPDR